MMATDIRRRRQPVKRRRSSGRCVAMTHFTAIFRLLKWNRHVCATKPTVVVVISVLH